MSNSIDAAGAYAATLKQAQKANPLEDKSLPSFGEVLKTSLEKTVEAQHTAERVSAAGLMGKVDMTEVIQAVNEAEIALNTVLALRDRVVQAYETVVRTPI